MSYSTTQRFSKDLCNCESLLQILDFLSMAAINKLKGTQRSDRGWYQIAWAFLKVTVEVNLCTVNVRSLIFLSVVLCTNLYTLNVRSLIFLVRGGRLKCSKSITRTLRQQVKSSIHYPSIHYTC